MREELSAGPAGGALRVLMVINAHTNQPASLPGAERPIRDYEVYRQVLGATTVDRNTVAASRVASLLARWLGMRAGLVLVALRAVRGIDAVYCDAENTGLPLALLLRRLRPAVRVHVVLHRPEGAFQRLFLQQLRAARAVAGFFVFGPALAERMHERYGIPRAKLDVLPMGVDTDYWRPSPVPPASSGPYVCSAGLEFRDYPTLVKAVAGLDLEVRIAAASPYSKRRNTLDDTALPDNVHRVETDTAGLRDLYASAALVVVPLRDVEFPAGLTTIVEAMASGKCVVVSRSQAQAEVIRDRRVALRAEDARSTAGGLTASLGIDADDDLSGSTGLYTAVGDSDELARALRYLVDHPELRQELGDRARRVAVSCFDHRVVAERLSAVLHRVHETSDPADRTG